MWELIEEKQKMLDKAINELAKNGYELAERERDYKIAINKKALELKIPIITEEELLEMIEDE